MPRWVIAVVRLTLRPLPRRVSGRWVSAAAASAARMPGTTSKRMPSAASASISSSSRTKTLGSPPLSRTTRSWASAACTSSALIAAWPVAWPKPRLPTSTQLACGARSRRAGSVRASNSTTWACANRCAPRTVIRSAAPGPAPMKTTRTGSAMGRWGATATAVSTGRAYQQGAAGAVGGGVDDDQRAAHAVVGVGLQRQGLLQLDHHLADLVDGQRVGVHGRQAVDVDLVLDGRQARLHPAVAVAHPVLAADGGRLGVQPGQRGGEALHRPQATGAGDPVAARDVELAIQHDAGRFTGQRGGHGAARAA